MVRRLVASILVLACGTFVGCHGAVRPAGTVVVIIESSPNNLDPRQGTDAQSERVGGLIFDALVKKDEHYNLVPWLATSWEEQPDAHSGSEDWVFHLRDGVRFQDGRPLEAADVVWTIESLIDPKLGMISAKSGNFLHVDRAEARDRLTVVVHMKQPDAGLLFNMSDGLFGVVPRGAGSDLGLHPVGSGPYRFVSQVQDKEVMLERWPGCWSAGLEVNGQTPHPEIQRLQFNVVPDTITSALELQKGSADAASNVLTPDMVYAMRGSAGLETASGPGSNVWYLNFNVRTRCWRPAGAAGGGAGHGQAGDCGGAVAGTCAAGGYAAASGTLGTADDAELAQYPHNPARAAALLEAAGYRAGKLGCGCG
jgi:peptide/nickel transport system substrate-binding protein